jgi:hypothetical protein
MQLHFQPNLGCGVCYETVDHACTAFCMPCCHHMHIVHHHCAMRWYLKQRQQNLPCTCPFCRKVVLTVSQFDAIYCFQDNSDASPLESSPVIYADADGFIPYSHASPTHPSLHIVHLTHLSYMFMCVNLIFIFVILCRFTI